jgi:hypothetical protein
MDVILLDSLLDPDKRQWAVLAIGMIAVTYLMFRPRFRKKDPLEKPAAFSSLSAQRAVERQMQSLLVELSEMARQISAQLDTRSAKLQLLIEQADEKIAQLKQLEQNAPCDFAASPAGGRAAESADPKPIPDPRHADVYALADQGRSAPQIAQTLGRPNGEVELILALRPRM